MTVCVLCSVYGKHTLCDLARNACACDDPAHSKGPLADPPRSILGERE